MWFNRGRREENCSWRWLSSDGLCGAWRRRGTRDNWFLVVDYLYSSAPPFIPFFFLIILRAFLRPSRAHFFPPSHLLLVLSLRPQRRYFPPEQGSVRTSFHKSNTHLRVLVAIIVPNSPLLSSSLL